MKSAWDLVVNLFRSGFGAYGEMAGLMIFFLIAMALGIGILFTWRCPSCNAFLYFYVRNDLFARWRTEYCPRCGGVL